MVSATPSKSNQMNQENNQPDCPIAETIDDSNADFLNTDSLHDTSHTVALRIDAVNQHDGFFGKRTGDSNECVPSSETRFVLFELNWYYLKSHIAI